MLNVSDVWIEASTAWSLPVYVSLDWGIQRAYQLPGKRGIPAMPLLSEQLWSDVSSAVKRSRSCYQGKDIRCRGAADNDLLIPCATSSEVHAMRIAIILLMLLLFCSLSQAGEIDRETFSFSLPDGWTEDMEDEMYDQNHFLIFENSESCLFGTIIKKRSEGVSSVEMLAEQKRSWQKRFRKAKEKSFNKWSHYAGKGLQMEGDFQGLLIARSRIFAFESPKYACVIVEFAEIGDFDSFEMEFEKIRKSFRLK